MKYLLFSDVFRGYRKENIGLILGQLLTSDYFISHFVIKNKNHNGNTFKPIQKTTTHLHDEIIYSVDSK